MTLDFESARQRFVELAVPRQSERVSLEQALGRVLFTPVHAQCAIPEFDTSAMDGYALNVDDIHQVPFELEVEGQAPAGAAPAILRRGTAMRIFTGAALPEGANAVVMQEHVQALPSSIRGEKPPRPWQNVRSKGEDLAEQGVAIERGQRLCAASLALASFLDRIEFEVSAAPLVTILATGSELRRPGTPKRPGSIVESISPVIAALSSQAGAKVTEVSIVADDAERMGGAIARALSLSDVLVTIGGVSVGDYDLVRPALLAQGVLLELHQAKIKPGKPITLGRLGSKVVVGLPGNPASAVITFALFAMPLLRAMQGDAEPIPVPSWVPLAVPVDRDSKRTRIVLGNVVQRGETSAFLAHPNQSSGATIALGQARGFAILEPGAERAELGTLVRYHRWSDL